MENHNQSSVAGGNATELETDPMSREPDVDGDIDMIDEEIESLAEVDPADAADRAVGVADRLARRLEEDER